MKRLTILILCLLLTAFAAVSVYGAGSASMSLSSSGATVYRGDTLTLTVKLNNDQPVSNGGLILKFDTGVFEITGGSCKVSGAHGEVNGGIGGGVFVLDTDKVVSGTIFTITVKVKSDAPLGKYTISGNARLQNVNGSISCSVSGTSVTVACKHSYGSSTKDDDLTHVRSCTVCGEKKTENHVWGKDTVIKEPTCKEEGSKKRTCTDCGATKTEAVPKTNNHKYGSWSRKNDGTHVRSCSVCGKQDSASHSWNAGKVTKKATCQETGTRVRTCTGCKAEKTETIGKAAHSYGSCTKIDDNTHSHECTVCGKQETAAHIWDGGKVTKEPTCTAVGEMIRTCTGADCGATKTEEVPVTEHPFGQWQKTDETAHTRICSACDYRETGNHISDDVLEHDESGHFTRCTDCGGQIGRQAHIPGPEPTETTDQLCTACGRMLRPNTLHTHEFGSEWVSDELGHWHQCQFCDEKRYFAAHAFEDGCDGECDVCGAERTAPHIPGVQWQWDESGHWRECTRCGEKIGMEAHIHGPAATTASAQCCTVCGSVLQQVLPHDHVYDSAGSEHSHSCPCGESYTADAESCAICAAQRSAFPWWIVCVAEAVCFGGVIAFLLLRRRKGDLQPEKNLI